MAEEIDLTFEDKIKQIREDFDGEWITVFFHTTDYSEMIYCALISNTHIQKSLEDPSWDLSIGSDRPGFVFSWKNGKRVASYYHYSEDGIEPLVIGREFHGVKDFYWEVSEEFRLYFNFYEDKRINKFFAIDDSGDEEETIIIKDDDIKIKLKYIKEFLSVKKMHLAIFFDFNRFSTKTIEEQGIEEYRNIKKGSNFCYSIGACEWKFGDSFKSQGWLIGKKLIHGLKDFEPRIFDKNSRKYEEFIIDIDKEGKEVTYTCNEDKLANFFGKNKDSPYFLTPVLFRKDVLNKYYSQPRKYSVTDGSLYCAGLWSLRMDNNQPDYVMVFLGDLGRLPHKEQLYWKSRNVAQKGKMSHTAWARNVEGEFTDPEISDLFFKQRFASFQENWEKKFLKFQSRRFHEICLFYNIPHEEISGKEVNELFIKAMSGNLDAKKRIQNHLDQDIQALQAFYRRIEPLLVTYPPPNLF